MKPAIIACLLSATAAAQSYTPGPQVVTFFSQVDDTDQPYGLYVPKGFDPARKYPLVISLHGAYSNHRLNLKRVFGRGNLPGETDAEATRYFPEFKDVPFLVASPLARGTMGYQGIAERDVYDVLADVRRRFQVDEDRIYLTGLSMGGGGSLWLGLTRPDIWAAIAPVCPSVPDGTDELAANALNIPVHLFHGDADPTVPVDVSRKWHKRLLALGSPVEYVEYPHVRHNSWDLAYRNAGIFDWFAKHKRDGYPRHVNFSTRHYRYNTAYWVRIDGLTPGAVASVDAQFTADDVLAIETENVDGFTITLTRARPVRVTVDGRAIKSKAAKMLSFVKDARGWRPGLYTPKGKGPGAEGPISAAVSDRHIYVYGTADSPAPEERKRRREQAEAAAEWSTRRLPLLLTFRTMADSEVKESDLKVANLFLFGTKETNSLIARFESSLPLAMNAGAADFGLLFIAPVGARYVVVNSGLSWWEGLERTDRLNRRYYPRAMALWSFGDYILFKGSLDRVVAEGLFDSQWRVPAEQATLLTNSGAVQVRK